MSKDGILSTHRALIGGASAGIGLACSHLLAAKGCQLQLTARDEETLDQVVDDIAELYEIEAEALATDLSEPVNAAALALDCEDVDILINAFGALPAGSLETLAPDDWKAGFELRVFGAINLTREVFEGMTLLGTGIIIIVGGVIDNSAPEEQQLCIISANATLKAFAEILDRQARNQGIRVFAYFPDTTSSDQDHANSLIGLISAKLSS